MSSYAKFLKLRAPLLLVEITCVQFESEFWSAPLQTNLTVL